MSAVIDIAGAIVLAGIKETLDLVKNKQLAEAEDRLVRMTREAEGWQALTEVYRKGMRSQEQRADDAIKEKQEFAARLSDVTEVKEKLARELAALQVEIAALKKIITKE